MTLRQNLASDEFSKTGSNSISMHMKTANFIDVHF